MLAFLPANPVFFHSFFSLHLNAILAVHDWASPKMPVSDEGLRLAQPKSMLDGHVAPQTRDENLPEPRPERDHESEAHGDARGPQESVLGHAVDVVGGPQDVHFAPADQSVEVVDAELGLQADQLVL